MKASYFVNWFLYLEYFLIIPKIIFFCETQTIFYTVKIQEDISKNRLIIPLTVLTFFSQTIFLTPQKNIKIQLTFFLKKKISQTSLEIS